MDYGMKFVWVDRPPLGGGPVTLHDDHGAIVAYLHRGAFEEDPDGFMEAFERHCDVNVAGHGWALELPVASGDGRNPVPSRAAHARWRLKSAALLPLTGCAWVAASFSQGLGPVVGS
jgi:hypothetical protein